MGRGVNDCLAKEVRTLHYNYNGGGMVSDEEILDDIGKALSGKFQVQFVNYQKLLDEYSLLKATNKELTARISDSLSRHQQLLEKYKQLEADYTDVVNTSEDAIWKLNKIEEQLVVEQGLSQFAIDIRELYYDEVGYTDNLNEVFDYYTSNRHTISVKIGKEVVSFKMNKEELKELSKKIVKKLTKGVK